ncbi:unnamed protein product, partial [Polarella glacialis]
MPTSEASALAALPVSSGLPPEAEGGGNMNGWDWIDGHPPVLGDWSFSPPDGRYDEPLQERNEALVLRTLLSTLRDDAQTVASKTRFVPETIYDQILTIWDIFDRAWFKLGSLAPTVGTEIVHSVFVVQEVFDDASFMQRALEVSKVVPKAPPAERLAVKAKPEPQSRQLALPPPLSYPPPPRDRVSSRRRSPSPRPRRSRSPVRRRSRSRSRGRGQTIPSTFRGNNEPRMRGIWGQTSPPRRSSPDRARRSPRRRSESARRQGQAQRRRNSRSRSRVREQRRPPPRAPPRSFPKRALRKQETWDLVPVDDVKYSQDSIRETFSDGRLVQKLVDDLWDRKVNHLKDTFMRLS